MVQNILYVFVLYVNSIAYKAYGLISSHFYTRLPHPNIGRVDISNILGSNQIFLLAFAVLCVRRAPFTRWNRCIECEPRLDGRYWAAWFRRLYAQARFCALCVGVLAKIHCPDFQRHAACCAFFFLCLFLPCRRSSHEQKRPKWNCVCVCVTMETKYHRISMSVCLVAALFSQGMSHWCTKCVRRENINWWIYHNQLRHMVVEKNWWRAAEWDEERVGGRDSLSQVVNAATIQ